MQWNGDCGCRLKDAWRRTQSGGIADDGMNCAAFPAYVEYRVEAMPQEIVEAKMPITATMAASRVKIGRRPSAYHGWPIGGRPGGRIVLPMIAGGGASDYTKKPRVGARGSRVAGIYAGRAQ